MVKTAEVAKCWLAAGAGQKAEIPTDEVMVGAQAILDSKAQSDPLCLGPAASVGCSPGMWRGATPNP